jgi:protein-disulfide isomerase
VARATRRDVLRIGVILTLAGLVMARPWQGLRAPDLAFEDIADLPPLRRLAGPGQQFSGGSAGDAVLVGLEPPGARAPDTDMDPARLRREICRRLDLSWPPGGPVPVTYFTDINCPVCRQLEADLRDLSEDRDEPAFRLAIREYPVFGPRSEAAARVIRAAAGQGRAEAVRRHLLTRPAPETEAAVAALAAALTLDGEGLLAAWKSPEAARSLREDRALAGLLAIPGTPGLVVGRTVIVGAPGRARLAALLAAEAGAGTPEACI